MFRWILLALQNYFPSPFIFAIVLTLAAIIGALVCTGLSLVVVLDKWGESLFLLLKFSMQMLLLLATGIALAQAPLIKKTFNALAEKINTPKMAIWTISFVSLCCCWLSWGFGLVVGAVLSKVLGRKVKGVDYPLLVASAYSGFLIWHGGLSGSIPLKVATNDGDLSKLSGGVLHAPVPLSHTIFSSYNLVMVALLLLGLPLINVLMHPKNPTLIDPATLQEEPHKPARIECFAHRLEHSPFLGSFLGFLGVVYLGIYFANKGFALNLNTLILLFLFLGLCAHASPHKYYATIEQGLKSTTGIVLLFPFYAGIIGVMGLKGANGISFANTLADAFSKITTHDNFALLSYLSAGLLNIFIPSGGGQFAVQGPVLLPSGAALGVDPAVTCMAIAWGDAWTNMIQPFFALPLLGIARLDVRHIVGYLLVAFVYAGVVSAGCLYFLT
ncbi:Short chain fatty acids transporter [Helicobacter heilmannii]|uniref:short-chain fatty acid transporter n=1 Tax=Helicobacter heilmannii TaxID=35817 RepID=UPI0006A13051|nr:TIGR00366 family protein [Helicobacter heilmannii]GMB94333.1 Short-chain fatty acids transporter AtoE [Helicobacter heilmannii]CRF47907.1 Short chain fatty acids transporter [Helicobacter heilmannii]